jgi:hypothetical protein
MVSIVAFDSETVTSTTRHGNRGTHCSVSSNAPSIEPLGGLLLAPGSGRADESA